MHIDGFTAGTACGKFLQRHVDGASLYLLGVPKADYATLAAAMPGQAELEITAQNARFYNVLVLVHYPAGPAAKVPTNWRFTGLAVYRAAKGYGCLMRGFATRDADGGVMPHVRPYHVAFNAALAKHGYPKHKDW